MYIDYIRRRSIILKEYLKYIDYICQIIEEHKCVCGVIVKKGGLHGLSCKKSAGRINRHDEINKIVSHDYFSLLKLAREILYHHFLSLRIVHTNGADY